MDQQLDHRDAVKIDRACVERGLTPYLLRAHEYIILKELKKVETDQENLSELLIKFTQYFIAQFFLKHKNNITIA